MSRAELQQAYIDALHEAVEAAPGKYSYTAQAVPIVAARMFAALDAGTAQIAGSDGFRRFAKRIGIKPTHREIMRAWNEATK